MPVISVSQKKAFKTLLICLFGSILLFTACGRKNGKANAENDTDPGKLARQYMAENKFDEAEASFIKAIQVTPDNILNYGSLGRLYLLQKKFDEAEKELKSGLKIKPDDQELELLLAKVYIEKGDRDNAVSQLKTIIVKYPKNVKAWYNLAGIGPATKPQSWEKSCLTKALSFTPANMVLRLKLAELYAGNNQADSARYFLESIKKMAPDFSIIANVAYQKAVSLLKENHSVEALPNIIRFHQLMKTSVAYASGTDEIEIPQLLGGYPQFTTALTNQGGNLADFIFTDASAAVGLSNKGNAVHSLIATADYDSEGNFYVYSSVQPIGSSTSKRSLFITKTGEFKLCTGIDAMDNPGLDMDATFADYDNDGFQDLFIATTKGMILYHNNGDGTFSRVKENVGLQNIDHVRKLLFADFDQDGDLDLYVAEKGGNKFFRNNGNGTFMETAASMG